MRSPHQTVRISANLFNTYPAPLPGYVSDSADQLTIGDLHGNTLKLIFLLSRFHLISISEEDYFAFAQLYRKLEGVPHVNRRGDISYSVLPQALTAEDLANYRLFLDRITVRPGVVSVLRLLGDEVCDRGANDLLTLLLLKKLKDSKVNLEILASNHGMEFIKARETKERFETDILGSEFCNSMIALQKAVDADLVSREEVCGLIDEVYESSLCFLSYSYNLSTRTKRTVYSHAPINTAIIATLAKKLISSSGEAKREVPPDLEDKVDVINAIFKSSLKAKKVHELFETRSFEAFNQGKASLQHFQNFPAEAVLWNRNFQFLQRSQSDNTFVHGHHRKKSAEDNVLNLDQINDLGSPGFTHASTVTLLSRQRPSYKPEKYSKWVGERFSQIERRLSQLIEKNSGSKLSFAAQNIWILVKQLKASSTALSIEEEERLVFLLEKTRQLFLQPRNPFVLNCYRELINELPGHAVLSKKLMGALLLFFALALASFLILTSITSFGIATPLTCLIFLPQAWNIASLVFAGLSLIMGGIMGVGLIKKGEVQGIAKSAAHMLWTARATKLTYNHPANHIPAKSSAATIALVAT